MIDWIGSFAFSKRGGMRERGLERLCDLKRIRRRYVGLAAWDCRCLQCILFQVPKGLDVGIVFLFFEFFGGERL